MCVCMCAQKHSFDWAGVRMPRVEVRGQLAGVALSFYHVDSRSLNSGCQVWQQALSLAEPSHQAIDFQFSNILRGHYKHKKIYNSSKIVPRVPLIQLHQQSTFSQCCFSYARVINGLSSSKSLI